MRDLETDGWKFSINGFRKRELQNIVRIGTFTYGRSPTMILRERESLLIIGLRHGEVRG